MFGKVFLLSHLIPSFSGPLRPANLLVAGGRHLSYLCYDAAVQSVLSVLSPQYFQDALIDVVTGLGVPADKIILNTPAFGNSFNLMEPQLNLPGSATTGLPQSLTYQQVGRWLWPTLAELSDAC